MRTVIVNRAERHYIKKAHKNFKVVDDLCFQSKNVYNYANYLIRQKFVETGEIIKRFDMQVIMKDTDCYKALGSNTGQVTIQMLVHSLQESGKEMLTKWLSLLPATHR